MTKIEQWQEWAKQHEDLKKKLADTELYLYANGLNDENTGYVKYDSISGRIIIHIKGQDKISTSVCGGKELLSVLKQLYE
jgi:hypothetical protein